MSDEPAPSTYPYFKAIEQLFLELRARATLVPPGDYLIAKRWHQLGIPLALIERTVHEVLERRRAEGKTDPVGLRYCKRMVENAWKAEQAMRAPAAEVEVEELDLAARLGRLGEALPAAVPAREEWQAKIAALAALDGAPEVERALARLDRQLLAALEAALDGAARRQLEAAIAASRARLAERLPEDELARAESGLAEQQLRARFGLPVLSLFAPEADS